MAIEQCCNVTQAYILPLINNENVTLATKVSSHGYLHTIDYVIFVILLLISLSIGVFYAYYGEGQNSTSEFLMGRRKLRMIPVAMSMFMSYVSAIFVLGISAEIYKHGLQYSVAVFGSVLASLVSAYLFVPLFYRLKLVSSYEYLELRYGKRYVRRVGTVMSMVASLFYVGIASFAPSTALEAVTGIPAWLSIIMLGVVVTVYTTLGGMKAVIWTDVFQGIVYIFGITLILIMGVSKVGGFSEVIRVAKEHGRTDFFKEDSFSFDPTIRLTFWSLIIGRMFKSMYMALRQESVQRFCALPNIRDAYLSVILTLPLTIFVYLLMCLTGLTVFAYYTKLGCDPLRAGFIKNSNQILPYFVINVLNVPGVPGLFFAVLYSGALSSISSSLSSLAAVSWKDFLEHRYRHVSELRKAFITKILVLFYGITGVILAFSAQFLTGHVLMLSQTFISCVGGPLNVMFMLGTFFPIANAKGAVAGALAGFIVGLFTTLGGNISHYHRSFLPTVVQNCSLPPNATVAPMPTNTPGVIPLFKISFMLHTVFAMIVAIIIGLLVSYMTGKKGDHANPDYQIDFKSKLPCCFFSSWKTFSLQQNHHKAEGVLLKIKAQEDKKTENSSFELPNECGSYDSGYQP